MSRHAVLDIGTNSVKFHAARVIHGRVTILSDEAVVTKLGADLAASGELGEEAMERTFKAVRNFQERASGLGIDKIHAVGTAAFRSAANADEFIDFLKRKAKLRVHVLPGEEEARLSALAVGVSLELPPEPVVVVDIGGGSTELVTVTAGRITSAKSYTLGVRTLTDTYARRAPMSEDEGEALAAAIAEALSGELPSATKLIGLGGTTVTLASIHLGLAVFDAQAVHAIELGRDDVERIYEQLAGATIDARRRVRGLPADRADVMPAGAALTLALLMALDCPCLTVCASGLRHGVFHEQYVAAD